MSVNNEDEAEQGLLNVAQDDCKTSAVQCCLIMSHLFSVLVDSEPKESWWSQTPWMKWWKKRQEEKLYGNFSAGEVDDYGDFEVKDTSASAATPAASGDVGGDNWWEN